MPKIRTSLYTILFSGLATLIIALVSHPAGAIVTHHDRDDGEEVVAVVDVRGGPAEQVKPQHTIEEVDWIIGKWKRESRRGEIYESWKRLSDRTVEGDSWIVSSKDGKKHPLESLLLVEMAGELFYIPKVAENDYPVPFRQTSMERGRVVFENPTHDFPQKIIYQLTGDDGLKVTIEGPVDGGESRQVEFHFRRVE